MHHQKIKLKLCRQLVACEYGRCFPRPALVQFPEHGNLSLVFAAPSRTAPSSQLRHCFPAVSWTRPPVPTELISVLILHTGSVQQEQESSPRAKSLPVCKCPKAPELGLRAHDDHAPRRDSGAPPYVAPGVDVGGILAPCRLAGDQLPLLEAGCS